jgi:hypothetical protein
MTSTLPLKHIYFVAYLLLPQDEIKGSYWHGNTEVEMLGPINTLADIRGIESLLGEKLKGVKYNAIIQSYQLMRLEDARADDPLFSTAK